jgi:hypothetical protein
MISEMYDGGLGFGSQRERMEAKVRSPNGRVEVCKKKPKKRNDLQTAEWVHRTATVRPRMSNVYHYQSCGMGRNQ